MRAVQCPGPGLRQDPPEFPPYEALYLDTSPRLWVERRVDAKTRRFEVFSSSGAFMAEIESAPTLRGYRPVIINSDRVLGFIADEDDVLHLASFRIVRG